MISSSVKLTISASVGCSLPKVDLIVAWSSSPDSLQMASAWVMYSAFVGAESELSSLLPQPMANTEKRTTRGTRTARSFFIDQAFC